MAEVRPFRCIRPDKEAASKVAALPYDVYNRQEAKAIVEKNPLSFLMVDRAETQFDDSVDTYAPQVYERAARTLADWQREGILKEDPEECYYLYELTMNGRAQTGIVACASIDDYQSGVIARHENTREEKELDRIRHVDVTGAHTGPIFLAYRSDEVLDRLVEQIREGEALYDFTSEDGIRHRVWKADQAEQVEAIRKRFGEIPRLYIADGHHRAASAVKVGLKRRAEHPGYTGQEEFNYFLSVIFPDDQLMIMPYNRVVKDLNGLDPAAFLEKVEECFTVEPIGGQGQKADRGGSGGGSGGDNGGDNGGDHARGNAGAAPCQDIQPGCRGQMAMYLGGAWYRLTARPEIRSSDPVKGLDVSLLQDFLLEPVLGIQDPRTDERIQFVGGIRGLQELERLVDGGAAAAFAMYPTSIGELFDVADAGLLMPPKSTWFEPKLRSGLFIHRLDS
ncbi:MAG TPA: DUF1015 domain-containing protein [Candidatus Ventrimonas merdavium]|nr:DUF1015 domain-containing protein [Candidatus Ventrimonas merdavium]